MTCDVRFSLICLKESRLSEELFEDWCEEVAEDGLGPRECGESKQWACAPAEWLKLWRLMAAAAGKKESVLLFLFMVNNLEVEEDLSTVATLCWAEGVL